VQFSQIDLNGDNIKDLFVFERDYDGLVKTFINKGTQDSVDYVYAPEYQSKFPQMRFWALLVDYNCDGKEDIFTWLSAGAVAVYRNDYDSINGLRFNVVTKMLLTDEGDGGVKLFINNTNIPAIVDVDNDGDIDILTFGLPSPLVKYHRNYSIENYGNCDSLNYVRETQCWGNFSENTTPHTVNLGIACKTGKTLIPDDNNNEQKNGGSTLLVLDLDGDADKELLIGSIYYSDLLLLINGGDSLNASMVSQFNDFPTNSVPVNLNFPAGFYLDVNNDGLKDLLAVSNSTNGPNFESVWYYKNIGLVNAPVFTWQKNSFLQDEMIEVGAGANPVFFDYDADGLLDLIIGNYRYNSGSGSLSLYKNVGTQTLPAFELITRNYASLSAYNLNGLYSAFGDLDADGDNDMIIGDYNGLLYYFDNTAGAGNTANFSLSQANYKSIDVGQFAAPQLVDVNGNGKLDLLIGERSGRVEYYENIGSATSPDFSSIATNSFFGGIDVMIPCCTGYSSPYLTKDSTGSSVMFVGSEQGEVYYYTNIDGNLSGNFSLVDTLLSSGLRLSVSGADINNDGKTELAVGQYTGGLAILKDMILKDSIISPPVGGLNDPTQNQLIANIFPNPSTGLITITGLPKEPVRITVYNVLGERVHDVELNGAIGPLIDLSSLPRGLYVIQLQNRQMIFRKKVIKQ